MLIISDIKLNNQFLSLYIIFLFTEDFEGGNEGFVVLLESNNLVGFY